MVKTYSVYFTFRCNWKCDYCIMDTHNQKEPENIIDKINRIEDYSNVSISGGEPGLGNRELVYEAFDILVSKNCCIHLNTNGLFIKNFPDLIDKIETINYHCSEDFINPHIERYSQYTNIIYNIVVTDKNLENLEEFIEHNKDLKFLVFSADKRINDNGKTNQYLSTKNIFKLYNKFKDNILKESLPKIFSKCTCPNEHLR